MKIAVVGTGYVGLVTSTCFAEVGNSVTCVDIDQEKVATLKKGKVPIYEPLLEDMFKRNMDHGRLAFTTQLKEGIEGAQIIFLALPTPPGEDGSADLSYVLSVAEQLRELIKDYCVIVNKSTVPIGTAELVRQTISKNNSKEFDVVSNPEFLREGYAVADFMKPDRVVIGSSSERAKQLMNSLYAPFVRQGNPIYFMDEQSAEMTKYAANSFLATKISFMNEIANLCEKIGANVDNVRLGIGADERIGKRFLFPGIGYGGSCFPKDVLALRKIGSNNGYELKILNAVTSVNQQQKQKMVEKINEYFKGDLSGKIFALWGLAFKPDTDDIREAPALSIIDGLIKLGATVKAYDPEALENVAKLYSKQNNLILSKDQYGILKKADALIIATEWEVFRSPDFEVISQALKTSLIFDGRNVYDPDAMQRRGFQYLSIGRKVVS